jgi:hypothetical protein
MLQVTNPKLPALIMVGPSASRTRDDSGNMNHLPLSKLEFPLIWKVLDGRLRHAGEH